MVARNIQYVFSNEPMVITSIFAQPVTLSIKSISEPLSILRNNAQSAALSVVMLYELRYVMQALDSLAGVVQWVTDNSSLTPVVTHPPLIGSIVAGSQHIIQVMPK